MKILYLEHPEADFGSEQLSIGLRQILGDDNVVDFPYKYCAHDQHERFQNIDVKEFIRDNPKVLPEVGYSVPYTWVIPSNGREYRYDEIKNMIKNGEFNFIIITPRTVCTYYLGRLIRDLNRDIPPVILCDFEDYATVRFDISTMFGPHIKVITKSSYDPNCPVNYPRTGKEKIYPLPLSSPIIGNPKFQFDDSNENKTIDVSARLGLTRSLRKDVVDSLSNINGFRGGMSLSDRIIRDGIHVCGDGGLTITTEMGSHLPYDMYLKELASSKISVSMYGHSLVGPANRTWEIPSYNTLLLTEKMNVHYEHQFEDGKTCVFFDPYTKNDVCNKIAYWLSDEMENERRKIAKVGHELLKEHHTCKARAQRLLEIVKTEGI